MPSLMPSWTQSLIPSLTPFSGQPVLGLLMNESFRTDRVKRMYSVNGGLEFSIMSYAGSGICSDAVSRLVLTRHCPFPWLPCIGEQLISTSERVDLGICLQGINPSMSFNFSLGHTITHSLSLSVFPCLRPLLLLIASYFCFSTIHLACPRGPRLSLSFSLIYG